MRLVLIRHAESTWNASGRWQGQSDVPLSPRGQLQVRALAGRLWELEADRLIASDLRRAQETAMALGEPELDPRFREIDVGEWAGDPEPAEVLAESNSLGWLVSFVVRPDPTRMAPSPPFTQEAQSWGELVAGLEARLREH